VNLILVLVCASGVVLASLLESNEIIGIASKVKLYTFFYWGGMLNVLLAGLNLLPAPPLDGSRILGCFFPAYSRFVQQPMLQMYGIFFVLVILHGSGVNYWAHASNGFYGVANLLGWPFDIEFR